MVWLELDSFVRMNDRLCAMHSSRCIELGEREGDRCVPDVRLPNASFKFDERTLFEKLSLHRPLGVTQFDAPAPDALAALRDTLIEQTQPVVDALEGWSELAQPAIWGQIAASWAAQFVRAFTQQGEPLRALEQLAAFFDDPRLPFRMQQRALSDDRRRGHAHLPMSRGVLFLLQDSRRAKLHELPAPLARGAASA
jgi:hypothetical protein